jgi:hypothetical protein
MENSKEKLIQELKAKEKKAEEQKLQRKLYNQKILAELPKEVNKVIDKLKSACAEPLHFEVEDEKVSLEWAYNKEKIGEILVKKISIIFQDRTLKLNLDPDIGYVGATAKINITTNNLKAEKKWPIHKGGIFITIGYKEGEKNTTDYIDKNYNIHTLTDEIILEILGAVFLETT